MSMDVRDEFNCCGIREIAYLADHRSPAEAVETFKDRTREKNFRYVVFSQAFKSARYGMKFAAYIKEQGLGEVSETSWNINPNSKNQLKVWVWAVDWKKLEGWGQ